MYYSKNSLFDNDYNDYNLKDGIKLLKKLEWTEGNYNKQSWGHPLHKIGPYVGRINPAFAHFLVKYISKSNDLVLDPFCGIGTINLECSLQGRNSIGYDLNPYAIHIAKAKTERKLNIKNTINFIKKIKVKHQSINLNKIPEWVKEYYNKKTLKEIIFLLNYFKDRNKFYLYASLLAISQGHRVGHLSKPSGWTIPYKPRPDDPGEYRDVKTNLISKILRNYKDIPINTGKMTIKKKDSRKLNIKKSTIDCVITSPPYFNTLDYVNSNRLRLAICGYYEENKLRKLKKNIIQHKKTYLFEMKKIISELKTVLKPNGIGCFILGDNFENNNTINTSLEISEILNLYNFKIIENIEDKIPVNKSVLKKTDKVKKDRILIFKKYD